MVHWGYVHCFHILKIEALTKIKGYSNYFIPIINISKQNKSSGNPTQTTCVYIVLRFCNKNNSEKLHLLVLV